MAKTAEKTVEKKEFKFGTPELAKELGIQEPSVRIQLRNKGVKKNGTVYGWDTKSDFEAVVEQIRSAPKKTELKTTAKKPAKKAKGTKKAA